MRRLLLGLSCALLLLGAAVAQEPRLDLDVDGVPLSRVLADITARTGVVFDIGSDLDAAVSVQLVDEPLSSLLRKLLYEHDYMMLYDSSEGQRRLSRVRIMARRNASSTASVTARPPPVNANLVAPRELVLRRSGDNPYIANGRINGQPVELLIDTGATTVAISGELAQRLGLLRGESRRIATASGNTTGYSTVLRRLTLGDLQLSDVNAIILPAMRTGQRVLLGMNALSEFELIQRGDTLILRQPGR